jgi:hypothetical protein
MSENQEALNLLKAEWCNGKPLVTEEDYKHCGDLDKATATMQKLVTRAEPATILEHGAECYCPACMHELEFKDYDSKFCKYCGKTLDWTGDL